MTSAPRSSPGFAGLPCLGWDAPCSALHCYIRGQGIGGVGRLIRRIRALRQLRNPLVLGSYKNGLSVVGKEPVAFSIFVELNCRDGEGGLKLSQRDCRVSLRALRLNQEERLPAIDHEEVDFLFFLVLDREQGICPCESRQDLTKSC